MGRRCQLELDELLELELDEELEELFELEFDDEFDELLEPESPRL